MVARHGEVVAGKDSLVMVHVSMDKDRAKAEAWAAKDKFPWFTLLNEDREGSEADKFRDPDGGVPQFVLVDKDGQVLARGFEEEEVFAKAAGL